MTSKAGGDINKKTLRKDFPNLLQINPFIPYVEKWCSQRMIFKVCLANFQHYAFMKGLRKLISFTYLVKCFPCIVFNHAGKVLTYGSDILNSF